MAKPIPVIIDGKRRFFDPTSAEPVIHRTDEHGWMQMDCNYSTREEDLYRLAGGKWLLLVRTHPFGNGLPEVEARVLADEEAAAMFLEEGTIVPPDLQSVAAGLTLKATAGQATLLTVRDPKRNQQVGLDIAGANAYELDPGWHDWSMLDDCWTWAILRTLYRLRDGRWFLVSKWVHQLIDAPSDVPDLEPVSEQRAAELMIESGKVPPASIVHLVRDRIISADVTDSIFPPDSGTPARISKDEANIRVRNYLAANAQRERTDNPVTIRELVEKTGCSQGLVAKTPAWRAVMEEREKRRKPRAPRAVNFSATVQAVTTSDDAELRRLIAEQQADSEPSPLEETCRRVRFPKRS